MSTPTVWGRLLRLVPRNTYKAPKHGLQRQGLYFTSRQLSLSNQQLSTPSTSSDVDNETIESSSVVRKIKSSDAVTKHEIHQHFWKTKLGDPRSPISYHPNPAAEPFLTDRTWLRDACTCERCVDASSGQKLYASTDIPTTLAISDIEVTNDGDLQVSFENDFLTGGTHVSTYPREIWSRPSRYHTETVPKWEPWNRERMTKLSPYYSYQSFMTDGPEYLQAMSALSLYGLVFLRDVPSSEEIVKDIAAKIGVIQDTFYGTTWDVKSKPNAENVAYTDSYLGLHQDLLYMRNVPRIQILHCLENTCEGGESIFSDSYRATHQLWRLSPDIAKSLTKRQLIYHYNKGGHSYWQSRAVLSGRNVYWSPPFQHPLQPDEMTEEGMHKFRQWCKAARNLKALFESWDSIYMYKMRPGECVIFDNIRVLHGRRAFNSSGERWLKGAYVENDSYKSLVRSLPKLTRPTESLDV
ncbi:hypothetical protein E0Z10_g1722 [Xylaria hypoxylon]|uniref:TauD/TfdA-like domain-containing protein n=1 Tax=Xylaria hypoxylon TaxID=37992 RepID=A0A4Z0ZBY7_9PEZI|nr:hypothetical protein E0Z10_g1722 [Xylaria hypoxylon]